VHVAIARMVQLRQQELAGSPGHTFACFVTQDSSGMLQSRSNVFHEEFNSVQSTRLKTWLCP